MNTEDPQFVLCNLEFRHFSEVEALMNFIYPDLGGGWPRHTFEQLVTQFPEGQIGIEDRGRLVGIALTLRVDYSRFSNPHTYDDLIDSRDQVHNNPEGDALYGLDVLIHSDYRGMRLGRRLYDARKELCRQLNLKAILAGGRIPNYHHYRDTLTPLDYIRKVGERELYDPIFTFQLSNDFQVKRLLKRYLPEDEKSEGYATLLEWNNILYDPEESILDAGKRIVRIGALQWQMRRVESVEQLLSQVEYFVDAVSDYQSDFILFPEFFHAALMGLTDSRNQKNAIRYLAEFTEQFRREMSRMAVEYNTHIITGSMPLLENEMIYNVSYLCSRDGSVQQQRKLHITPHEKNDWIMTGGSDLKVFETDAGRVGILICYDVEFPELGRILADEGVEILFVPYWTDTKNSYLRVRHCAQARAVENECYVVIAGSIGNLPSVDSLDVQYAQSAVFTPSDLSFPHDGVLSEATPNTEMLLFADLDLNRLKVLHNEGTVTNLKDRRHDLYRVQKRRPPQAT